MISCTACPGLSNYERKGFASKATYECATVHQVCILSLSRLEAPEARGLNTETLLLLPLSFKDGPEDGVGCESTCLRGQAHH